MSNYTRGGGGRGGGRGGGHSGSCFKCGGLGHMSRDCPKAQQESGRGGYGGHRGGSGSRGGYGNAPSRACFNCGDPSHMSNECPNPRQDSGRGGYGGYRGDSGSGNRGGQQHGGYVGGHRGGFANGSRGGYSGQQSFGSSGGYDTPKSDTNALVNFLDRIEWDPFEQANENKIQRKWLGKEGTPLRKIITNFVKVPQFEQTLIKNLKVYRVDLKRGVDGKSDRPIEKRQFIRELFWLFVQRFPTEFKGSKYFVFDDSHKLYSLKELDFGQLELDLTDEDELVKSSQTHLGKLILSIKQTKEEINILAVLNLLLTQNARCPYSNLKHVYCDGDRIYNIYRNPKQDVDYLDLGPIQLLKGLRAIMKQGPGAMLANYDVSHSAFSKFKIDILEFYALIKDVKMTDSDRKELKNYGLNDAQRRELKYLLNGLNLKTKEGCLWEPRNYKFTNVVDKTAQNTIVPFDGKKISTVEYYAKKYGYEIRYPNMPMLQCGPKEKNLLFPIEVLQVSERLQRIRQKLPEYLQARCTPFTTKAPDLRFKDISRMLKETEFDKSPNQLVPVMNDPFLENFGVKIDHKLLEIDGRILPKPNLDNVLGNKPQDMKPVVFSLLAIGNFKSNDYEIIETMVQKVVQGCIVRKMKVENNQPFEKKGFTELKEEEFDSVIKERVENAKKKFPNALLVIFVVVPDSNDFVYNTVKTKCELALKPNIGAMTQFLLLETLKKKVGDQRNPDPSRNRVVDNIVRKINAKSGGINVKINQHCPLWRKFTDPNNSTLFIGIDVTHPSPGEEDIPSIAAVVGNIDLDGAKYGASVRQQERLKQGQSIAQEPVRQMNEMVNARLKAFVQHTGKWPKNIIIFRDGVSESQFEMVRFDECLAAKAGCLLAMQQLKQKSMPRFAIVVVQKRHTVRFWAKGCTLKESKNENLPPGTVIEKYITREPVKGIPYVGEEGEKEALGCDKQDNRCEKEFYLCSHQGLLGTSRPGRYNVIYDEIDLSADDVQQMAYALCYLYAPTSMPVSIPAPVYYAHKACYRARKHYASLKNQKLPDQIMGNPEVVQVHPELVNKMYFC